MSEFKVKITEAARVKWCKEQFGGTGEPKYYMNTDIVKDLRWWCRVQGHLFFREEKDYIWFRLKWS